MAEGDGFVGLKTLKPGSETQLMASVGEGHAIFKGVEVAVNAQVAAIVAPGQAYGCLRIRRRATADDYRANRLPQQETRDRGRRSAGRGRAGKKITCARKANPS